ncbi:protein of unknown function [Paenibacillus uliginis N3/975]|uniref:DUF4870 domain-containing protein n=1 Tax=Paenibacillus uliginis N3/975 TaxID=1313296 RepID=A0A1X7HP81_9BACL|nr:DUF4870 domain-containing protein [Paenibacillus sp. N3/727]UNK19808.1 DUF4870 domain-containing protein [Paenibacillus sp. N3/727]SMF89326.1 protein of unknown function [Paenibacillus uliginis N3/975]
MRQLLSSLSYFSIFFAPFILPIIVWIVAKDAYVEKHAKRALLSHLFPVIAAIVLMIMAINAGSYGAVIGYVFLFGVIYFGAFVYNVVQGIKVLREYA